MTDPSAQQPHVFPLGRRPGEMLFSVLLMMVAAVLLAALPWQTSWIGGKGLAAQPRFWPALSLAGVILFALLHLMMRLKVDRTPGRWKEGLVWIRSVEYIGWYMIYVAAIPIIGYLPATVAFCVLLTLRVGYRGKPVIWAAIFGLAVVLFFKTAMNVKIPAGALYEFAPNGLRYILLRYF